MSAAAVDIRLVDLDRLVGVLDQIERRIELLSDLERDWTGGADNERTRRRRAARIALRLVLLRSGVGCARRVPFETDRHGKPALNSGGFSFNVSHSDRMALLAVASAGPIGIDLESPRRVSLGSERQALIISAAAAFTDEPPGCVGFLQAWTLLEAFAKARGSGIGALLTELGITAEGVRILTPDHIAERARALLSHSSLAVRQLTLPENLAGAICGPARALQVSPVWKWLTQEEAMQIAEAA